MEIGYGVNVKIEEMVGKTFTDVRKDGPYDDQLIFETDDYYYIFHHYQDCCESVQIEEIIGDLLDLVGKPLERAEESTNSGDSPNGYDSVTWTFYKFATIKGEVVVRWLGTSNGYYSESVSLVKIEKEKQSAPDNQQKYGTAP